MSDDLLALQDADALLAEKAKALYVGTGLEKYLPSDAVTRAAFGALCGARTYIEALTREHVTGRNANKNAISHPQNTDAE